jgi:hypothetical protein
MRDLSGGDAWLVLEVGEGGQREEMEGKKSNFLIIALV